MKQTLADFEGEVSHLTLRLIDERERLCEVANLHDEQTFGREGETLKGHQPPFFENGPSTGNNNPTPLNMSDMHDINDAIQGDSFQETVANEWVAPYSSSTPSFASSSSSSTLSSPSFEPLPTPYSHDYTHNSTRDEGRFDLGEMRRQQRQEQRWGESASGEDGYASLSPQQRKDRMVRYTAWRRSIGSSDTSSSDVSYIDASFTLPGTSRGHYLTYGDPLPSTSRHQCHSSGDGQGSPRSPLNASPTTAQYRTVHRAVRHVEQQQQQQQQQQGKEDEDYTFSSISPSSIIISPLREGGVEEEEEEEEEEEDEEEDEEEEEEEEVLGYADVMYDYEAGGDKQLGATAGDVVMILQEDRGGWCYCGYGEARGFMPSSYLGEERGTSWPEEERIPPAGTPGTHVTGRCAAADTRAEAAAEMGRWLSTSPPRHVAEVGEMLGGVGPPRKPAHL